MGKAMNQDLDEAPDVAVDEENELERIGQKGAALAVGVGLFLLLLPFLVYAWVAWIVR